MKKPLPLLVIQGPTASGKTAWALRLAEHFPLEVISADSRQVYRRMDIGTAKATDAERAAVRHHMIDLVDPDQSFNVADFADQARIIAADIHARGKLPCVVGGTGLYIRALIGGLADVPRADEALRGRLRQREVEGGAGTLYRELQVVDPQAAAAIHPNNLVKIIRALEVVLLSGRRISQLHSEHAFADKSFTTLNLAPCLPKEILHRRIAQRTGSMLTAGLLEETAALVADYGKELKSLQTLGYREALACLEGVLTQEETGAEIERQTRLYAKRQLTWFGKVPDMIWVDSCEESGKVYGLINNLIQQ